MVGGQGGGPALPWDVAQHVPELGGHTNVQSGEPYMGLILATILPLFG